jgi:hypothetical protein
VKFSARHSQIFEYHQLRFDELVKNFLNYEALDALGT